jgi:hypothetical protein
MMKTYYSPGVNEDIIYENNDVLKRIYANKKAANSRVIYGPVDETMGHSTHGIAEDGTLPTAAAGGQFNWQDSVQIVPTRKDVSQLLINLTKNSKYNYMGAIARLNHEIRVEHGDYLNKYLMNSGGYLGQCASESGNKIVMAAETNMNLFKKGMTVDVLIKSTGIGSVQGCEGVVISVVSKTDPSITVVGTVNGTIDSTNWVCVTGDVTRSSTTQTIPLGLPDLIQDAAAVTVINGVTISSHPDWIPYMKDLSGADVSVEDFQEIIDELELHTGSVIEFILCSAKFRRRYQFDLCEPQQMRSPGEGTMGTGEVFFRGASKKKIPLLVASYCNPLDDVYFIDPSALTVYHGAWMEFMDDDGKYLTKTANKYLYEATMSSEFEIIANGRPRLGRLENASIS